MSPHEPTIQTYGSIEALTENVDDRYDDNVIVE
jgi:hypothetical protein